MSKTNKQLSDHVDFLLKKSEHFSVQYEYLKRENDQLKRDMHFLTQCMLDEKSFSDDIKVKLNKILFWTKQMMG